jgi:hypothetical protein
MLIPGVLIIIFVLFFAITFWRVLKAGDELFIFFYAYLFIYTIFTQLGYAFFPDPAIKIRVYFGPELFYSYWLFIFLSFAAIVGLRFLWPALTGRKRVTDQPQEVRPSGSRVPFLLAIGGYIFTLMNVFYWNFEGIRYASTDSAWVGYLVNLQPVILLIIYMDLRRSKMINYQKLLTVMVGLVGLVMFLVISIRAGQRLAGLALLTGMAAFEFSTLKAIVARHRKSLRKVFSLRVISLALIAVSFLALAGRIVSLREKYGGAVPLEALTDVWADKGTGSGLDLEQLMYQDYFAPSSLLFVSMATGWVDPAEVFRSNAYNAVPFTGYPYLQNILSEVANPVGFSRTESYGYYILNEGYNSAGWLGILYNALMVNLGLGLWRFFAKSRDPRVTERMIAVLCLLVVSLVRGPSVFFVRYIYLTLLPALALVRLSVGYLPARSSASGRKKFSSVELSRSPSRSVRFHPLS